MTYERSNRDYGRQRQNKQRQRALRRRAQRKAAKKGVTYAAWNALPEGVELEDGSCGERRSA